MDFPPPPDPRQARIALNREAEDLDAEIKRAEAILTDELVTDAAANYRHKYTLGQTIRARLQIAAAKKIVERSRSRFDAIARQLKALPGGEPTGKAFIEEARERKKRIATEGDPASPFGKHDPRTLEGVSAAPLRPGQLPQWKPRHAKNVELPKPSVAGIIVETSVPVTVQPELFKRGMHALGSNHETRKMIVGQDFMGSKVVSVWFPNTKGEVSVRDLQKGGVVLEDGRHVIVPGSLIRVLRQRSPLFNPDELVPHHHTFLHPETLVPLRGAGKRRMAPKPLAPPKVHHLPAEPTTTQPVETYAEERARIMRRFVDSIELIGGSAKLLGGLHRAKTVAVRRAKTGTKPYWRSGPKKKA